MIIKQKVTRIILLGLLLNDTFCNLIFSKFLSKMIRSGANKHFIA